MNRQRMQIIDEQWLRLEEQLSGETHSVVARLVPLVTLAKQNRYLKQLFPYLSHERFCLSFNTAYPWSYEFPCVEPIPNFTEFTFLVGLKELPNEEFAAETIGQFLKKHQFLQEKQNAFLLLDDEKDIVGIKDKNKAINLILEQCFAMYVVFENSSIGAAKNRILGIANARDSIELLVSRVAQLQ